MADENLTFRQLASWMNSIGLSSLFSYENNKPSGWLWEQVKNGVTSDAELLVTLQDQPEFQQRFPIIAEQQAEAAKGNFVGTVMTPEDVLLYEQEVKTIMRTAGLPSTFYDEPEDFVDLMRAGVNPVDVGKRINESFEVIQNAPSEVRDMFDEYFGVGQGESALAAYVLDPDMVTDRLERQRNMAFAGAVGARYDIELTKAMAEDVATAAGSLEAVQAGMESLGQRTQLFGDTIGEGSSLSLEREGLAGEFGIDTGVSQSEAQQAMDRKLSERRALGRQAGGAVVTQEGVTGLG